MNKESGRPKIWIADFFKREFDEKGEEREKCPYFRVKFIVVGSLGRFCCSVFVTSVNSSSVVVDSPDKKRAQQIECLVCSEEGPMQAKPRRNR